MSYKPYRDWFIDYNDLATQTVPIIYTTWVISLTNDWAWPYSTDLYKPKNINTLWNTTTNQFDFSALSIWDELTIRLDILVTTASPSQVIKLHFTFDIWWTPYDLTIDTQYFKDTWTYNIVETEKFYIWWTWMINNPWELRFTSDAWATITVNWFYISVCRK
jgi:hypothetical protein